ncbi:uncharacterized protein LOC111285158 isoform X1 [Durio zibethinus]|uniref:Uncharacterized protein LOC111285158 isoform X1 n=1 Tax=Durio zibethinus TaxID=66656 RepID=A0A6P5XQK8_DURZI|nr:uncharacterized protein LOC111285158 isoform X1 [Durio zibethinus]
MTQQTWNQPINGLYMVYFDGALDRKVNKGGIGLIIRNSEGDIMGASVASMERVIGPFVLVEANAAVRALDFAFEMGFQLIIIEGDALGVLKKLKSWEPEHSPIRPIMEQART